MSKTSILNGILIGLIVVLAGVILVQDGGNNAATAAEGDGGGMGVGANGVIAVTGQILQYNSVLYIIDTNREVILTYACYTAGRGNVATAMKSARLTFLNGRVFTYDAALAKKAPKGVGLCDPPTPGQVRDRLKEDEE